jgi:site-specific DNA-cytosine methylase
MENVVPRLLPTCPFSVKLNAFNFGDVTTRKRWFYSSHLLHVIETPGPRRFGDIRDHEADRVCLEKRGRAAHLEKVSAYADADAFPSLTAHAWHGHDIRSNGTLVEVRKGAGARVAADDEAVLGSVTADSWHGKNMGGTSMVEVGQRSYPQAFTPIDDNGALGSVTSHTHDQPLRAGQSQPTQDDDALGTLTVGKGGVSGFLKVGLRGHSASASAFQDDEPIGSLIANSWHGNEISRLGPSVRCPSLLEMQRAHSFPDDFDWCGATKTARGRYIANSWPVGMATAVCRAMLVALGCAERAA